MQEDIENRAVALAIKSVKLTGHGLKVAIAKYLAHPERTKAAHGSHGPSDGQTADAAGTERVQYRDHGREYQVLSARSPQIQRKLCAEERLLGGNPQIPGLFQGQGRGHIDSRLSGIRRPGNQTGKETHDSGAASQGAGQKKNAGAGRKAQPHQNAGEMTPLL